MESRLKSSKLYLGELCRNERNVFELRYKVQSKEDIETWLRNVIVLVPKKKVIERLECQTRGICVQIVLTKWYCGCLYYFDGDGDEECWKERHGVAESPLFWV